MTNPTPTARPAAPAPTPAANPTTAAPALPPRPGSELSDLAVSPLWAPPARQDQVRVASLGRTATDDEDPPRSVPRQLDRCRHLLSAAAWVTVPHFEDVDLDHSPRKVDNECPDPGEADGEPTP